MNVADLDHQVCRSFEPTPRYTVSEWADANRVLSKQESSAAGPWDTALTPYLREPMDCLSPWSPWRIVVIQKAARLGFTEVALNWLGAIIDVYKSSVLLVYPTGKTGERTSRARVDRLIEESAAVRSNVREKRERDSGRMVNETHFDGGVLYLASARSPAELASITVKWVVFDEVDRFPGSSKDEGDPVMLAVKRTATYWDAKSLLISSPGIAGFSRIAVAYQGGDQRLYNVPCPLCARLQPLWFRDPETKQRRLVWPHNNPRAAVYECAMCTRTFEERHKTAVLAAGGGPATADGDGRTASFFLNGLYRPLGWTSWGEIASEYVAVHGDPTRLQVFVNTEVGETWEERHAKADPAGLLKRREPFHHDSGTGEIMLPEKALLITAGVDVQANRLECEVVAWGPGRESWSLIYERIFVDPTIPDAWDLLDRLLLTTFAHPVRGRLPIHAACVDTGYLTSEVYRYCDPRHEGIPEGAGLSWPFVWAIKGRSGDGVLPWPGTATYTKQGRHAVYPIGVDAIKATLFGHLRINEPSSGYCHFPDDREPQWFDQLTAEKRRRTLDNKGRPHYVWELPKGARNEALDCRVYAMAALEGLDRRGITLEWASQQAATPNADPAARPNVTEASPARPARNRPPGGSWYGR